MRFLKSIHWQRALHKRQVFLLPPGVPTAVWGWRGVRGPRSRYLQTKAILMARSGCTGLTHCISIFSVIVFLRLRDPGSLHLPCTFPGLARGPF